MAALSWDDHRPERPEALAQGSFRTIRLITCGAGYSNGMSDNEGIDPATPPQDTGPPDPVETDPAALNSAEDLDEDRLQVDPLEKGMDPPERWSAADRYGTTPYEQSHPQDLDHRLREEEPDVEFGTPAAPVDQDAVRGGRSADVAGGSMAETIRTPEEPTE